ncbi:hypothetical protein SETIT_3G393500v2 [Setaria italica]|uniref:NB-ARC domain-containing protein n=1 Tax=Setaria italica TaxID=4555 RepID=A0A368QNZ0_SETIT|nr:hypothetical protein SETIT_3G393500v2 [Setaria italica]
MAHEKLMVKMALASLRWVASPIANKLLADASTYLGMDMSRELQELESTILPQFELVIEAAEKSPHRGKLEKWLQDLKAAFYNAEDVLDEHEYNKLKRNAKQSKWAAMACGGSWPPGRLANLHPGNRRLLRQVNELKDILVKAKSFRKQLGVLPAVLGRDMERDHIIQFLLNDEASSGSGSARISSLAIVGLGGMGKSTLAQYVYNDKRVEEYFGKRMWVCISRKLDVRRHTREIIESAEKGECPIVDNLDTLQYKLRDILQKSERFLLVLDDVWFDESNVERDWEQLLAPLASKQRGSKILVTSRRNVFPAALCCQEVFDLQDMEDSAFLTLLREHAFSGAEIRDAQLPRRLGQSPLAAKTVGSQLSRKKDVTTWTAALRSDNLSEPMTALLWSYEKLDPRLQRCFLYCSLFPKGHKYNGRELVHLWTAEGFIDLSSQSRRMEDIGSNYLNELIACSFLQPGSDRFGFRCYIMHDLLHDLAEKLSRDDCFRLEDDDMAEIPCTVRHLSVHVKSMKQHKQSICKLRHLRTVICIGPLVDDADDVFHQVLQNLKRLRVLYMCFYNKEKLPESVGELKHLRYLNVIQTTISEFPASLCTLYHLQILLFSYRVQSLPKKLCNLSKLLSFEPYGEAGSYGKRLYAELPQIPYIGKLTSLQNLDEFRVQKQKGYELRQLRDMNGLGGRLSITHLENVTRKDEAAEMMLHKKRYLEFLRLIWSSESDSHAEDSLHLDILEGLRPPAQLEGLAIEGYKSHRYPSWLLEGSYFDNLDFFRLHDCTALEGLPLNTEVFRHCSRLVISDVPNLKTLPCLPEGMAFVSIEGCPLLMFISSNEMREHDKREKIVMPEQLVSQLCLIWELDSESYPLIKRNLHEEHSSLKQLTPLVDADISQHLQTISGTLEQEKDEVYDKETIIKAWLCCHEQRIKLLYWTNIGQHITNGALGVCLGSLTLLRELSLTRIMTLTALPSEEVFQHLTALDDLRIDSCWCLRSLGGLRAATFVTEVSIECCPSLELTCGAESMPLSLETLSIDGCVLAADFLSNGLTHLKHLHMYRCRSSASLSIGHLTSLESLQLHNVPDLCMLEGLSSLQLQDVGLVDVPKLSAGSISQCCVQKSLCVSRSDIFNHLLSAEGCTGPEQVQIQSCNETSIFFETSANFTSVKELVISECRIQSLPKNMKDLSCMEKLEIAECPNISSLPDLPSSLKQITIYNCKLLSKDCREPDGISWPKIAHIPWRYIN